MKARAEKQALKRVHHSHTNSYSHAPTRTDTGMNAQQMRERQGGRTLLGFGLEMRLRMFFAICDLGPSSSDFGFASLYAFQDTHERKHIHSRILSLSFSRYLSCAAARSSRCRMRSISALARVTSSMLMETFFFSVASISDAVRISSSFESLEYIQHQRR